MVVFAERTLGPKANEYIRECLGYAKTLGKCLLALGDLAAGKVTTYLPTNVTDEEAHQFSWGDKLPKGPEHIVEDEQGNRLRIVAVERKETTAQLVSLIRSFMADRENAVCILSTWLKPSDPAMVKTRVSWVAYGEEVYVLVLGKTVTEEEVVQAINRAASAWWSSFVGAMASSPSESSLLRRRREITGEELQLFAERAEKIVVGAYDMEGFVIWHKP